MGAVDVVRIVLAVLALVLAMACGASAALAPTWDQRGRFLVVLGYAAIILGGQLDQVGQPATWRTWALAAVSAYATVATIAYLVRYYRGAEGRTGDGRSADDQRRVLRPRARARRARNTGDGPQPKGGSAAP